MAKMKMLLAVLSLTLLMGCSPKSPTEEAEAKALFAAKAWLAIVDEGKYDQSWDLADGYFQTVVSKAQWVESLTKIRQPMGGVVQRSKMSQMFTTSLPGAPEANYVQIQFQTTFPGNLVTLERITPVQGKDGQWRVAGYYIFEVRKK